MTHLLEEAAEWRLLGLLFEYPSPQWRRELEALLLSLPDANLRALAHAALAHATEGMHHALFGPGGSVPVREVSFSSGVQLGYLMSEITAYYNAFDYHPKLAEAPDHIAVQLGFLAYLKLKQAFALAAEDQERAQLAAGAAASFLKDHLAISAEPIAQRLEQFAPDYLVEAAHRILQHTGPAPRNPYPLGSAFNDDSEELTCGESVQEDGLVQLVNVTGPEA
jgi:nitrate reductase assembly molybdenum cofactor insertion protein NarJ